MELLNAELKRKRGEAQELFGDGKRQKRKAELEAAAEQKLRLEEAEEARRKQKPVPTYASADEQNTMRFTRYASEQASVRSDAEGELHASEVQLGELENASAEAVTRRLRALHQPARFFAEDELERKQRLAKAEANVSLTDDAAGTGQRREKSSATTGTVSTEDSSKSSAVINAADRFKAAAERLKKGHKKIHNKQPEDEISEYFAGVMDEWENEVESASDDWKFGSLEGTRMRSTIQASRKQLNPLLTKLHNRELSEDLVRGLYIIMRSMKSRNYRNAGDMYIRLSIGNQPWPIGITKVGIHERSARDKLQENKVSNQTNANVMADEQTRKYLQCIKRLITFAQRRRPTEPSHALDFNSGINGWDRQELLSKQQQKEGTVKRLCAPEQYSKVHPEFKQHDGWKAWDKDTRTMTSILANAYTSDGQGGTN